MTNIEEKKSTLLEEMAKILHKDKESVKEMVKSLDWNKIKTIIDQYSHEEWKKNKESENLNIFGNINKLRKLLEKYFLLSTGGIDLDKEINEEKKSN